MLDLLILSGRIRATLIHHASESELILKLRCFVGNGKSVNTATHHQTLYPVEFAICFRHFATISKWNNFYKLTLKAPITTAADDIHKYFYTVFQRK